jgi:rhodanese-related sulfurtransferase
MFVTLFSPKNTETCTMKKLLFAATLISLSWLSMSCSTTVNSTDALSENAQASSIPSSNGNSQSDTIKAIVIDVRTQGEWDNDGHAPCTTLIPLDQLEQRIEELRPYEKITGVCRSGARAGNATQLLKSKGFKDVNNAGPWQNAPCK